MAAGITVDIVAAPFSAEQLRRSRTRILSRAEELGIGRIGHGTDGGGSTVQFRTAADLEAAKAALAEYEHGRAQIADQDDGEPAVAVLHAVPGTPAIRISDQLRNPQQHWLGVLLERDG